VKVEKISMSNCRKLLFLLLLLLLLLLLVVVVVVVSAATKYEIIIQRDIFDFNALNIYIIFRNCCFMLISAGNTHFYCYLSNVSGSFIHLQWVYALNITN
jgi:uncharacterized BrkB/YihY/UPF0761 family membrane protein